MKVEVLLFARARDAAGTPRVTVDLPAEPYAGDVRAALAARCPGLAPLAADLLVAVGNEYADDHSLLPLPSEIACFLPVSGG